MLLSKLLSLHDQCLARFSPTRTIVTVCAGSSTLKSPRYLPKWRSSRPATGFGRKVFIWRDSNSGSSSRRWGGRQVVGMSRSLDRHFTPQVEDQAAGRPA
jgi:hypothetical protein